jgi:hypothetical protein
MLPFHSDFPGPFDAACLNEVLLVELVVDKSHYGAPFF